MHTDVTQMFRQMLGMTPMLTTSWIIRLPADMSEQFFEDWYLNRHTVYAKNSDGLLRYTVNRAYRNQPDLSHGDVFRIAQLWWEGPDALVDSFQSYSGSASRGDTYLNATLAPEVHPSMTITNDFMLPVSNPAQFDLASGTYAGTPDGMITKVMAFGLLRESDKGTDQSKFTDQYFTSAQGISADSLVRSHRFGCSLGRRFEIGRATFLPGRDQVYWDWALELAYDSRGDCLQSLSGSAFSRAWSYLTEQSATTQLTMVKGQELMISCAPRPHTET